MLDRISSEIPALPESPTDFYSNDDDSSVEDFSYLETDLRLIDLLDQDVETLQLSLNIYYLSNDVLQLEELLARNIVDPTIKFKAFLHLIAYGKTDLNRLKELADAIAMDFNFRDLWSCDALLLAAASGRVDVMNWLIVEKHLPLTTMNNHGLDLVLYSIYAGKNNLEVIRLLTNPIASNGYGLSLETADSKGRNAVLIAAAQGKKQLLRALTTPTSMNGFGLSLAARDADGNDAVLTAVITNKESTLRMLVATPENGGLGCTFNTRNNYGFDAVLLAVTCGHIELLNILINDFGLSLATTDALNRSPVELAVMYGQVSMLNVLIQPQEAGGYNCPLILSSHAVTSAILNNHLDIVALLVLPIAKGGYGYIIPEPNQILRQIRNIPYLLERMYPWLFVHIFSNEWIKCSLSDAINWLKEQIAESGLTHAARLSLVSYIQSYLREYINPQTHDRLTYIAMTNELILLATLLEELLPLEGMLFFKAQTQAANGKCYFSANIAIYSNTNYNEIVRQQAAADIAITILSGKVILTSDGMFDEENTPIPCMYYQDLVPIPEMQQRAVFAFQYAYNNPYATAHLETIYRYFLGQSPSPALPPLDIAMLHHWELEPIKKFYAHYQYKNPALLKIPVFKAAVERMQKILSEESALLGTIKKDLMPERTNVQSPRLFRNTVPLATRSPSRLRLE